MARLFRHVNSLNLLILGLIYGCTPQVEVPRDDLKYAPLTSGQYWVYAVQDERYSLTQAPVLSTYFVKETIGDLLSATQDSQTYKLVRAKRSRTTDSWKTDSAWTVQQWPDKLIRTENTIAYVRLRFPVSNGVTWNQNEYNTLPTAMYQFNKAGESFKLATKKFDTTVQVSSRQNDSTAISLNRQLSVYAYQTGLIYKENTALAYCQSTPDCIGKGQIASGFRQRWTLVETGME